MNPDQRLRMLGVDLERYPGIFNRDVVREIVSRRNRSIQWPIVNAFGSRLLRRVPDPLMMTHIVTTKCNYLCSFCSFSDSLNQKTNDLSLGEIERVYETLGNNLHVLVYSGGETTLNPNLPDMIEAAYRLTSVKSVYIISNAWKPELLFSITHRIMQRCPGLHLTWSLSIEGPRETNNRERRTHAASWDAWQNTVDTLEGLKAMRRRFDYRELDVQLCTVCSPDNQAILDDWYLTVRDVLQPDKWNLNLMRRSVQMSDHQMESFAARRQRRTLEPFEHKYLQLVHRIHEDVLEGRLKFLYHTETRMDGALKSAVDLISQAENTRTLTEASPGFCCRAGTMGAYISSQGDVSGCEEFAHHPTDNKSFGNLRLADYDFQALWRSQRADTIRQQVGTAAECQGCTLESQRNYPSILVSLRQLGKAATLASRIQ